MSKNKLYATHIKIPQFVQFCGTITALEGGNVSFLTGWSEFSCSN